MKRGQFADDILGQDFARAEIALAAEVEVLEFVADAFQGGDGLEDLDGFGGDFGAGPVAAHHGDAKNVVAAHVTYHGEVGEGLVGVGHAVDVLALGVGGAFAVVGLQEFAGQLLVHGPPLLLAAGAQDPADGQRLLTGAIDLHRHLVRGPADALRADLDVRLDVLDGLREDLDRLGRP